MNLGGIRSKSTDWTNGRFWLNYEEMSKAVKAPVPDAAKLEAMPFEEAMKRLEAIVEAMESEDLPLENLLTRFEEGTRLAKACQEKLADAELKIQKIEKNNAGELTLKPLPPEITGEKEA